MALLKSERISFDVSTLTRAARDLRSQINATYQLMCEAYALDGLALAVDATVEKVRMHSALHRAAPVDADLDSMRGTPAHDAPAWTVDVDEHGGFVATTTSEVADTGPWKFWGSAATAASAAHTLAWFFRDRPPNVVFWPHRTRQEQSCTSRTVAPSRTNWRRLLRTGWFGRIAAGAPTLVAS